MSKISPRAAEAIHLGFDPQRNGYLVYIPSLNRFTSAYHIKFHEHSSVTILKSNTGENHVDGMCTV